MGQYDAVVITESPTDEDMAAAMLGTASMGCVRTETMR